MFRRLAALVAAAAAVLAVATSGQALNSPQKSRLGPDLVVTDTSSRTVTIRNEGSRRAGSFAVTVSGRNGCDSYTFRISRLAAGASVRRSIPTCSRIRTVRADRYDAVSELRESNNSGPVPARGDRAWDRDDDVGDWDGDDGDRDDDRDDRDWDSDADFDSDWDD